MTTVNAEVPKENKRNNVLPKYLLQSLLGSFTQWVVSDTLLAALIFTHHIFSMNGRRKRHLQVYYSTVPDTFVFDNFDVLPKKKLFPASVVLEKSAQWAVSAVTRAEQQPLSGSGFHSITFARRQWSVRSGSSVSGMKNFLFLWCRWCRVQFWFSTKGWKFPSVSNFNHRAYFHISPKDDQALFWGWL